MFCNYKFMTLGIGENIHASGVRAIFPIIIEGQLPHFVIIIYLA